MKQLLPTFLIIILFGFIYTFKLTESAIFHPDFARDIDDITKIIGGDITLIGPKLTFGGIYSGPYYYYLLAPIVWVTTNISAVFLFNAILFALGMGYFFYLSQKHLGLAKSGLATIAIGIMPLFLIASRNPSNAFTYLPVLLGYTAYIYFENPQSKKQLMTLGLIGGMIATFHLVTLTVLIFLSTYIFFFLKKKKLVLFYLIGFATAFAPLVLFELKHNFVMFRNTFIDKSYMSFVKNTNILSGVSGKKNILENFFFIGTQMKPFTLIHPLIYLILLTPLISLKKLDKKTLGLVVCAVVSYLFLATTLRFQFINHYLFPVSFLILFTFIVSVARSNFGYILFILMLGSILFWPKEIYKDSWRTPARYQKAVQFVINHEIVKKDQPFNIIQITIPDMRHPWGYEYRSFFRRAGYQLDDEKLYSNSQTVLLFSEDPKFEISKLKSWEAEQFGLQYFEKPKNWKADTITIYKVTK